MKNQREKNRYLRIFKYRSHSRPQILLRRKRERFHSSSTKYVYSLYM